MSDRANHQKIGGVMFNNKFRKKSIMKAMQTCSRISKNSADLQSYDSCAKNGKNSLYCEVNEFSLDETGKEDSSTNSNENGIKERQMKPKIEGGYGHFSFPLPSFSPPFAIGVSDSKLTVHDISFFPKRQFKIALGINSPRSRQFSDRKSPPEIGERTGLWIPSFRSAQTFFRPLAVALVNIARVLRMPRKSWVGNEGQCLAIFGIWSFIRV